MLLSKGNQARKVNCLFVKFVTRDKDEKLATDDESKRT